MYCQHEPSPDAGSQAEYDEDHMAVALFSCSAPCAVTSEKN
jgi:hypothetical protein